MSATPEEREAMLGVPNCLCGTKMKLNHMVPDADGIRERWHFECPKCGGILQVERKRAPKT